MAYLRRPLTPDGAPEAGNPEYFSSPTWFSSPSTPPTYGFAPPPPAEPPPPVVANPGYTSPTVTSPSSTPAPNTSGWNTESYGIPGYTASNFGSAPSGWDATKWVDPNHQTPKYVWGRIAAEAQASGDPNWQQIAVDRFLQAYPGTTYGGRDVINTPWGEEVDIFRDYGGENGLSWQVNGAGGGGGGTGFDLNSILASLSNRSAGAASSAPPPGGGTGAHPFADPGFQAVINSIGAAHPQWAEYQAWLKNGGAGGGAAAGGSASTGPTAPQGGMQALYDQLGKLLSLGGEYNEGILNRRVESARESMNRARGSQSDLLRAQLAERGILGSGAEVTAMTGLEEDLGDIYGGQVRDIYADESARADQRLLETMAIAAGLSGQDAQRIVDWFNAQTGREVGLGQIAATNRRTDADSAAEAGRLGLGYSQLDLDRILGTGRLGLENLDIVNRHNLGLGSLGLQRDLGMYNIQNNQMSQLLEIIKLMNPAAYQQITNQQR